MKVWQLSHHGTKGEVTLEDAVTEFNAKVGFTC